MSVLEWIAIFRASLELAKELREFLRPQKDRIKTERQELLEEFYEKQLRKVRAVRKLKEDKKHFVR